MSVYVVERVGIYGQGVLGVYGSLAEAKARAEQVTAENKNTDGDGYHRFVVSRVSDDTVEDVAVWKADVKVYRRHADYKWETP